MSHEAVISPVQLLLFDDSGYPCAGLSDDEPANQVLLDVLGRAGIRRPGALPDPDVAIAADQLPFVLDGVRAVLRETLAAMPIGDTTGAYDAAVIEVLGERVQIRVRDPRHYELKRLNGLYSGLERAAVARRSIDIFAIPGLDAIDRAILAAARDGVTRVDLVAVLRRRFAHQEAVTASAETIAALRRRADAVDDKDVVDAHLTRLEAWNLLRRENGMVRASRKLMTIRV